MPKRQDDETFSPKKSFFTTIHHPNQFIEGSPESGQTADIII